MSKPKRLHPLSMLFTVIQTIRQMIVSLLPPFIIAIGDRSWLILGVATSLFLVLIVIYQVLSWFRYTYQVEDDQIRIEQGILIRKRRTISKHRIQSIDLSQSVIHRIFGLTKVQIETAGNDHNIDAKLHAVRMHEGKALHDHLKYNKHQNAQDHEASEPLNQTENEKNAKHYPSKTIRLQSLFIAGSTSGSFGVIIGLIGVSFSELESLIPDHYYNRLTNWVFEQAIPTFIFLAIFFFILLWAFGILMTLVQYWNFTITRYDKELFITRGLLEKKQSTIPLKRIQAVGINETVIRQPLGFATLYVEVASGEVTNSPEMYTILFPLIRKKQIAAFLEELLPEYRYTQSSMAHVPKRALPYYLVRMGVLPLIATTIVGIFAFEWIVLPLVITVLALILAYFQYKVAGYQIEGDQLTLQSRKINKDTVFVNHKRLQSFKLKQHIFHRKQDLASLDTAILSRFAGRHLILKELNEHDVDRIANWYSYRNEDI
ncbi:hypothetical protein J416_09669 [Gracilibacillus halophilus YIM-C55.5]|uniref:YdbS-like PH domain-containing protein n=1 Tax=Gracilibacillus halophilus YIM-C55.5 TaxID=1308866 RepID=N4WQA6_9BACI|nr:PH domain-containing protein [Gracilibacillus halophilus]ENH96635.1 hypothetical protein J416_09669 [Gracilibacillus halophilus YIM-C55.5]